MLAFRHLTSRPLRTALTVVGVGVGVAAAIAMFLANQTVFDAFQRTVTQVVGEAAIHISGAERRIDERLIERIRAHPGVQRIHPFIAQSAILETEAGATRASLVWGLDLVALAGEETGAWRADPAPQREFSLDSLLGAEAIFVDRDVAASLGVGRGDRVMVRAGSRHFEATVRGTWPFPKRVKRWGVFVVMDIAAAQVHFARLGRLDGLDLVTLPGASVDRVIQELQERLGPSVLVSRSAQRNAQVQHMLTAFQLNLTTLSAVGLFVGIFLVYNAVGFSVVQYRREIGLLRAIGLLRRQIGLLFLGEAIIIGAVGGSLGAVFGSGLAHWLVALEAETVSELYGMETPGVPAFSVLALSGGCLLGMALSVIGALGPCREASRTAPAQALAPGHYETTRHHRHGRWTVSALAVLGMAGLLSLPGPVNGLPVFGYAAAFCVLLGCALLAPLGIHLLGAVRATCFNTSSGSMTHLAVDQIAASSGRNSVTLSAFMVGIAIVVGVGVMVESFRGTVEQWIDQTIMADLIVTPHAGLLDPNQLETASGLSPDMILRARAVPGVAAVDPYRHVRVQAGPTQVSLVARDLSLHAERSQYLFVNGESSRLLRRAIAEKGVVISEVLAHRLGVDVGDALALPTNAGRKEFGVVGVFYDYATDGGKVVMDRSLYRQWWGDATATVLGIYLDPHANAQQVRRDLHAALAPLAPVAIVSNRELRTDVLAVFDRTFRLTYGLEAVAVIVGLLGIMNTLLTTVVERRREFATFRAIGASRGQVRGLVLRESLCLGLLGLALGLLGGVLLAALLIGVINKQSFGWSIHMTVPVASLMHATLIAGVTSLVAGWLPARWATRGEIADGLRYE